ncbi:hypothetical protein MACH23_34910 [Sulfitobacter pontiacus]|nr:transposase domain-containing protein [Sulfitobacter pontiacus]GLO80070.1 hypothetical protein MACH23_34910 [Sulfitobacter pontiacus]
MARNRLITARCKRCAAPTLTAWYLICGSEASLICGEFLNGIEPHRYLSGVLIAIAGGHKQTDINKLLPWDYAKPA